MKPQSARPNHPDDSLRSTIATASQISHSQIRAVELRADHGCVYNMNDCFLKLKGMVPNVPSNKRLSKVEILQYVIDYIQDLQYALETHPAIQRSGANQRSAERIPLSTISCNQPTNTVR